MEKHSLSPALSLALIITTAIALSSCRTQTVVLPASHTRDSTHLTTDRRLDSTFCFVRDSIVERYYYGVPDATYKGCGGESGDTGCFKGSEGALPCNPVVERDRYHTAYKDCWHTRARTDTITVIRHDSIKVPVPIEPPPRKSLALSERVRVLGKGCLLGVIGAFLLAIIAYILLRIYLHR